MRFKLEEVLKADIVLAGVGLLASHPQRQAFIDATKVEVSQMTVEVDGQGRPGIPQGSQIVAQKSLIVLNRDRISLDLSPDRSIIKKDYPTTPSDLNRLVDIVALAFKNSQIDAQSLQAYGCNVDAVYSCPSGQRASQYIAEHVFAVSRLRGSQNTIVSGEARLQLRRDDGLLWNLIVAPRFNEPDTNKLYVNCNPHVISGQLPQRTGLYNLLKTGWDLVFDIDNILE